MPVSARHHVHIQSGLTGGYMPMAITITTEQIYEAFYADYNEGKAFMHTAIPTAAILLDARPVLRFSLHSSKGPGSGKRLKKGSLTEKLAERLGSLIPHVGEIRHRG